MGEIKSAFEKAMEKVEKLEKASPEELNRMKYVPEGNILAAKFLKNQITNFAPELSGYSEDIKAYLMEGLQETLLRNIILPISESAEGNSRRAIEGILALKAANKAAVQEILGQIGNLFDYYQQAVQQNYAQLKQQFEMKINDTRKMVEQQTGVTARIDVEMHPQFQEEWRKFLASLNAQYEKALEEQKHRIEAL